MSDREKLQAYRRERQAASQQVADYLVASVKGAVAASAPRKSEETKP